MQKLKNSIITAFFTVAIIATTQAQDIDTSNNSSTIGYESFKKLDDKQMSAFLKENDAESYAIFRNGEKQRRIGKSLFIPSIAITGVGVGTIAIGGIIIPLFALISFNPILLWWWEDNVYTFLKVGAYIVAAAQPLWVASIVLQAKGGSLKKLAKNNYENKFFKGQTTSLNFNLYPNGFGVSLRF